MRDNEVFIAGHNEIRKLLSIRECISALEEMFKALARSDAVLPLRQVVSTLDKKGALAVMPAYLGFPKPLIGGKFITVFPNNTTTPFESHQGCVLIFECENGRLLGIVDASTITAIRTAAASAVATKLLARKDAVNLAILGSGTQASMHLAAMEEIRQIEQTRIWSRSTEHAKRFVAKHKQGSKSRVEVSNSVANAVKSADIICTTTMSTEPILKGEWLPEGCHVNAIGASRPSFREIDSEAVRRSRLYTDRTESLIEEGDEFRIAKRETGLQDNHLVGEIGELLLGKIPGRINDKDITLFKSFGIATEDIASAYLVYAKGKENRTGNWVNFGALRSNW